MHRLSTTIAAVALAATALTVACSEGTAPRPPVVADIVVTGLPDTVGLGDTLRLRAQPRGATGASLAGVPTRWRSLSPTIALVDSAGALLALDVGDAALIVAAQGRTLHEDTIVARVRRLPRRFAFTDVPDSVLVSTLDTIQVEVRDGEGRPLGIVPTWSSSDSLVLRVDSIGRMVAVNSGVAWIRATAGGRSDSVRVRGAFREMMPGRAYTDLSVGWARYRMCAVTGAGELWCLRATAGAAPERVRGSTALRTVETGQTTVCGLAVDSTAYCWDNNSNAQFGLGTTRPFSFDTLTRGGGGLKWHELSVGYHHAACGIQAADSVVYCWGHNDETQTGRPPRSGADSLIAPFAVPLKARSVDVAAFHACAVALDGALWCWGQDMGYQDAYNATGAPVRVQPPGTYLAVATGDYSTCALDPAGAAWCWGYESSASTSVASPGETVTSQWTPRRVETTARFVRLAAGMSSRYCGLTATGELHCWSLHPSAWERGFVARRMLRDKQVVAAGIGLPDRCALTTEGRILCW